jgi:colicin import membrane protein
MDATTLNLDVPDETVTRIVAAADQLFKESGKSTMPNVDSVRRKAYVNMNDASKVIRAWRKALFEAAAPVPNAIPERLHDAGQALMHSIWKEASDLANSSLTAAQAGWESERIEAEGFRSQLAAAFDQQSQEMQSLQTALRDALTANEELQRSGTNREQEWAGLLAKFDATTADAKHAHERCGVLQRHIDDIGAVLARTQDQAALAFKDASRASAAAATEITRLHSELLRSAERTAAAAQDAAVLRSEMKLYPKQAPMKRSGVKTDGHAAAKSKSVAPKGRGNGNATG